VLSVKINKSAAMFRLRGQRKKEQGERIKEKGILE
jgi:hypothetical protein